MSAVEVWVCRADELTAGVVRTARLGHDEDGRPIEALLLRDESGVVVAYRNLCQHLPVPLDGGTGELLSDDAMHLVCGTHGASYRLNDGYCFEGPCEGMALQALAVRVDAGEVYISR